MATFSLVAAAGVLLYRVESPAVALGRLSPTISIAAAALVTLGLSAAGRPVSGRYASWRTAALTLALLGGLMMVAGLLFAWPEPLLLILVGVLSFATLTALAVNFRQLVLHVPALACLAIAYLIGFQVVLHGSLDFDLGGHWLSLLWMGRTSAASAGYAAILAAAGWAWLKREHSQAALPYLAAASIAAILSLFLALGVGFSRGPDAEWTTIIIAGYSLLLLLLAVVRGVPAAAGAGALVLLAATLHLLSANVAFHDLLEQVALLPQRPIVTAALIHSLMCSGMAAGLFLWLRVRGTRVESRSWEQLRGIFSPAAMMASLRNRGAGNMAEIVAVFTLASVITSAFAALFTLFRVEDGAFSTAWRWLAIAGVWLAVACVHRRSWMMTIFGWAASLTLVFCVTALAQRQEWWNGDWSHPRHFQYQFVGLATWSMAWVGLRRFAKRYPTWSTLLDPPWATSDQVGLGLAVVGIFAMTAIAAVPGIRAELGWEPTSSVLNGANVAFVHDSVGWAALFLLLLAVAVSLLEKITYRRLLGLCVSLAAAAIMIAIPADAQRATASALRWSFAAYGGIVAASVCARGRLAALADRCGWLSRRSVSRTSLESLRATTFLLTLVPVLGLTLLAAIKFLRGDPPPGPMGETLLALLPPAVLYAGPMLALVGVLIAYAVREKVNAHLMAASVWLQIAATLACLLVLAPTEANAETWIALLQANAVALGAFSWVWLALQSRIATSGGSNSTRSEFWEVQLGLGFAALIGLGAWATTLIYLSPGRLPDAITRLGSAPSYLALALTLGAGLVWSWRTQPRRFVNRALIGLAVSGAIVSASVAPWSSPQRWTSYYGLLLTSVTTTIAATAIVVVTSHRSRNSNSSSSHELAPLTLRLPELRNFFNAPAAVAWVIGGALPSRCCRPGHRYPIRGVPGGRRRRLSWRPGALRLCRLPTLAVWRVTRERS